MALNNTHYFYNKLNQFFENNIKYSFISGTDSNQNIILITKEDKVYEFYRNAINHSFLVFSNNKIIIEKKINELLKEELCNKGIIEFKNGYEHTIARTTDGKLYCWGRNWWGVLGNGKEDEIFSQNFYGPELNEYLKNKQIIEMSCGYGHSIVLTINGEVYSWGCNWWGQIGNGMSGDSENQTIPYLINKFNGEKVKAISCGLWHSLALTESGKVYSWGENQCGQLGINTSEQDHINFPTHVEVKQDAYFVKISCGHSVSLLLSNEGELYVSGSYDYEEKKTNLLSDYKFIPINIDNSLKFTDIASHYDYNFSSALTENGIYYIWGKISAVENYIEPKATQLKSFNEIFIHYLGITFNTFREKIIEFDDYFIRNGFYDKNFNEIEKLGEGCFGVVNKVESLLANKSECHAVKIIELKINEVFSLKELENFSVIKELTNEKVVEYYDLWIEYSTQLNAQHLYVFIQMELCDITLQDLMNEMKNNGWLIDNNYLTLLGYYISSELFLQIIKGINFLHTRSLQIIHRDLKPDNILLVINNINKNVIKIADMGLICLHNYVNKDSELNASLKQYHTEDVGSIIYAAPEVLDSKNYDTKSDIYSLGKILSQMFLTDNINDKNIVNINTELHYKYLQLIDLCERMTEEENPILRPDCEEILNDKHMWILSDDNFDSGKALKEFLNNSSEEYKNGYIFKLIDKLSSNLIIHQNVKCDECGIHPIFGIRYKCNECEDYDLCQICIEDHDFFHKKSHTFMSYENEIEDDE